MQDHQYITDRWMPEIVERLCHEKGIDVRSFSDKWMLTLTKNHSSQAIYGFKFGGLNDSAAVATSQDKAATYDILHDSHIDAVPHALISTRANSYHEWKNLAEGWQTFVIKPTHGGGGRAVYAFDGVAKAAERMETHAEQSWCVSPFLQIKSEVRLILLDKEVLLAFEKQNPTIFHGVPMYNLRLGAAAVDLRPNNELIAMADAARRALGLRLVAVDIVVLQGGERLVLEVNEGFSLEHYMRQSSENKQRATEAYGKIIDAMMAPGL